MNLNDINAHEAREDWLRDWDMLTWLQKELAPFGIKVLATGVFVHSSGTLTCGEFLDKVMYVLATGDLDPVSWEMAAITDGWNEDESVSETRYLKVTGMNP